MYTEEKKHYSFFRVVTVYILTLEGEKKVT